MASTLGPVYRAPPIDHLPSSSREQPRDLNSYQTAHPTEEGRQSLPSLDPISRPSSTSTVGSSLHHTASLPQLPGLSTLASIASNNNSPHLRAFNGAQGSGMSIGYNTSSPSATSGGGQSNSPIAVILPLSLKFVLQSLVLIIMRLLARAPSSGLSGPSADRAPIICLRRPIKRYLPISKNSSTSLPLSHNPIAEVLPQTSPIMATIATTDRETSQPTCQNCTTSTTPLWRRDEIGSVLCNACGLFLKLHGRPRPISLKTDVIKSRNRVKSSGAAQGAKKKSLFDSNGLDQARSQAGTPPPGSIGHRRTSQKSANGHSDGSNSPISRTATPSMYGNHLPTFNGHQLVDDHFNHSPSLPPMHLRQPSPGRSTSPLNGTHGLEVPQTYEQLIAQNSSLKTRVSELEVINELFRGRVTQLEQDEANARRGEEMRRESEASLLTRLEESQRRENQLKRRLDDVERELADLREGGPRAKKMRVADMVGDSESSTPQSAAS
ncbi:hypothetical protein B7463_g699, partial [Scytalidium lignicola]